MDQQEFQAAVIGHFQALEKRMDGMDARFDAIDVRMDNIDGNMDLVQKQIAALQENMHDMKEEMRDQRHYAQIDHDRIMEIHAERRFITLKWGWQWALASVLITIGSIGITQTFTILWLT